MIDLDRLRKSEHWQTLRDMGYSDEEIKEIFTAPVPEDRVYDYSKEEEDNPR